MWEMSSSSARSALDLVDGTGPWAGRGPHYSRRTPGSRTFTGVGQEVVLVHSSGAAVWAVVRQRTPAPRGTGASRGREGRADLRTGYVWRNMLFRRMPECPDSASELIRQATRVTYALWAARYGRLPLERLRTEIDPSRIRSTNPGYSYKLAGWHSPQTRGGKLHLYAPCPCRTAVAWCACCPAPV